MPSAAHVAIIAALFFASLECPMLHRTLLSVILLSLLLTACGQKGPLYLPVKPPVAAAESAAPADGKKEDKDEKPGGPTPAAPSSSPAAGKTE